MASKHLDQLRRIAAYMPTIKTLREPRPVGRRQDGASFARPYDYDEHDMVALAQYVAALEDMAAATMRVRAELDAVTRERDTAKAGTWSRVEREVHLRRERDEAIAILAARDTAIAELRAALESARLAIRQGAAQEARNITEDALTNKEDAA